MSFTQAFLAGLQAAQMRNERRRQAEKERQAQEAAQARVDAIQTAHKTGDLSLADIYAPEFAKEFRQSRLDALKEGRSAEEFRLSRIEKQQAGREKIAGEIGQIKQLAERARTPEEQQFYGKILEQKVAEATSLADSGVIAPIPGMPTLMTPQGAASQVAMANDDMMAGFEQQRVQPPDFVGPPVESQMPEQVPGFVGPPEREQVLGLQQRENAAMMPQVGMAAQAFGPEEEGPIPTNIAKEFMDQNVDHPVYGRDAALHRRTAEMMPDLRKFAAQKRKAELEKAFAMGGAPPRGVVVEGARESKEAEAELSKIGRIGDLLGGDYRKFLGWLPRAGKSAIRFGEMLGLDPESMPDDAKKWYREMTDFQGYVGDINIELIHKYFGSAMTVAELGRGKGTLLSKEMSPTEFERTMERMAWNSRRIQRVNELVIKDGLLPGTPEYKDRFEMYDYRERLRDIAKKGDQQELQNEIRAQLASGRVSRSDISSWVGATE